VKNSKKRILLPPAAKQLKSLAEFHAANGVKSIGIRRGGRHARSILRRARRQINWNPSRRTTCASAATLCSDWSG